MGPRESILLAWDLFVQKDHSDEHITKTDPHYSGR